MKTQEPELQGLLFETSPYGNIDAIVQHDGRAIYFYLNGDETFGTRACWIRNLVKAPYVLSDDDLQQGLPPLMPRTHCRVPDGQPLPEATSLQVVWLEEGNGAALFENDRLLAVIPPWSGIDGFHGYSDECVAESPLAWPLMDNKELRLRIENAKAFWHACSLEKGHPFGGLQAPLLSVYRNAFQCEAEYFSMDGGKFPPRGAAVFRQDSRIVVATVGMSFRPQPNVEMAVELPAGLRRIELAIDLDIQASNTQLQPLLEQLSGLIAYPWKVQTWFGHGHTCQFTAFSKLMGNEFDSAVFVSDRVQQPENSVPMPHFRDDPVQLLWLNPITSLKAQQLASGKTSID